MSKKLTFEKCVYLSATAEMAYSNLQYTYKRISYVYFCNGYKADS